MEKNSKQPTWSSSWLQDTLTKDTECKTHGKDEGRTGEKEVPNPQNCNSIDLVKYFHSSNCLKKLLCTLLLQQTWSLSEIHSSCAAAFLILYHAGT